MFVDADDWLENDCIENFVNAANNHPDTDFIFSKINIINEKSITQNNNLIKNNQFIDSNTMVKNVFINHNSTLTCVDVVLEKFYKINFLKKNNNIFFNIELKSGEDIPFSLECIFNAKNIFYLNIPTYNY